MITSGRQSSTSRLVRSVGLALSVCLLVGDATMNLALAENTGVLTGDVRVTVNPANIKDSLPVPGGNRKVTMSLHDVGVQDALRALAQKGGFNVLIDESVAGNISVDLNNVSIQDALETLKSYGNLAYQVNGKNLVVAEATSAKGQAFKKTNTHVFHLKNANAKVIADFLNSTVFAERMNSSGSSASSSAGASGAAGATAVAAAPASSSGGGSSSSQAPVTADYNTNSLIVVGDPVDIKVVEEHLSALDQPRQMKTWRLSQANVLDVASALASSLFNEGQGGMQLAGGSSSSSGPNSQPASVRVIAESVTEGSGASSSAPSSGGSGGSQTPVMASINMRTRTQTMQTIQLSPNGPILLPDTRLNTLTLMGTAEQIALAEPMIAILDRKVPQLVLEASLVEIKEDGVSQLGFSSGVNDHGFGWGSNNLGNNVASASGNSFTNSIGRIATQAGENVFRFSTNPTVLTRDFFYQINALVSKDKAKILANPTIITSSDNEATISIVDEFVRSVTRTQGSFGGAASVTYNIGNAGIVLNLLPKVGANKTISMRVRPVVTTVASEQTDLNGNLVTLLSRRESLAQNVQVNDGETFILGGLIHNTNTQAVTNNPLLANMPILGALARNTAANKHRSELVIMVTPHIVNDESELSRLMPTLPGGGMQPANYNGASSNSGKSGMVPVAFTGSSASSSSALPPVMPVQAFNSTTHATDPLEGKSRVVPGPHPSSALMQDDAQNEMEPVIKQSMKEAKPKPSKKAHKESVQAPKAEAKFVPTGEATFMPETSTTATDDELTDDKIKAIMEKFK